ncbi:MAG: AAA family ATPase [Bacteroidota bacterium]|nr:AAA family ATPase [Bacteroidota bacterium]
MLIIGITGTLGAGKGTIVEYLTDHKGFKHFSVRAFLIVEIKKRGLIVNRDTMTRVANELRAQNSPSYIVDCLFEKAVASGENCVIESIRTPGEIDSLRNKGRFILLAVDADAAIRYERVVLRNSETDRISFDTFIDNEQREMNSDDPNKQNLHTCIQQADYVFSNNGTLDELTLQVEKVLREIENHGRR